MSNNPVRNAAKEYYETHRISFAKLSEDSVALLGYQVSVEMLKHWSSDDGGWKKSPISEADKLSLIANRILEKIEDDPELSARDLTALATAYLQYATKLPEQAIAVDQKPTLQQLMDLVNDSLDSSTD